MVANLERARIWKKLSLFFSGLMFFLHLWSFIMPGWPNASVGCNRKYQGICHGNGFYSAVEGLEISGFLCNLIAFILALCLIWMDEVKENLAAKISFVAFAMVAGVCIILGILIYEGESNFKGPYAGSVGFMGGICGILAGVFGILDIVKKNY